MPLNPKQTKKLKQQLNKIEQYFTKLDDKTKTAIYNSKDFKEFLENTKDFTTGNILVTDGVADEVSNAVILANNFNQLKQRELVKSTIKEACYDLVKTTGDDLKNELREMAQKAYDLGLGRKEIARALTERDLEALYIVRGENTFTESEWQALPASERAKYTFNSKIKVMSPKTRVQTIARTETKRAETMANYIRAQERGHNKFKVTCRSDCCPYCAQIYQDLQDYQPTETKETILNDGVEYDMQTDIDKLPPFHPNSYDKETFVFTDKGWKLIKDINPNTDKVLSLKPDVTKLEFIKPNCIIKHCENQIINMENKWFDIAVTADHEVFIHQRRDGGKNGRYFEPQFRKPDELNTESRFLRTVDIDREQPEFIDINGLKFKPKDYAFFMAWYISKGSILHNPETAKKKNYPVKISQQIKENRTILEKELMRICDYLGLKLRVGKTYFEIPSKALHDYLLPLGYSNEKYIPSEVFKLNKKSLNIFLDNYVRGDGHERNQSNSLVQNSKERVLFTSSTKLRDDLCYLILLCGYYPSIYLKNKKGTVTKHKNGTYSQNYDVWTISINKSKYTNYSSVNVKIDENYNDYAYCVVLPKYHTLWVMRNGKTSWNGNCRCSAEFYKGVEDTVTIISENELLNKTYDEILNHYNFKKQGNNFIKTHENGQKTTLHIDEDVIKNNGYKTVKLPEIVDEIGRADLKYTKEINLLNYNDDDLEGALGINKFKHPEIYNNPKYKELFPEEATGDPEHKIYFNTKLFNEEKYNNPEDLTYHWRFMIRHEIAHSADITKKNYYDEIIGRSGKEDYQSMMSDEFTRYSKTNPMEHFAEHGGYINTMLAHPELQDKTIRLANGEKINFKQYKERFKDLYKYFTELI